MPCLRLRFVVVVCDMVLDDTYFKMLSSASMIVVDDEKFIGQV